MPQTIAITGASGLVGSALSSLLTENGHSVLPMIRTTSSAGRDGIRWDPSGDGLCNPVDFANVDAVVHLAGENIASGRWNDAMKQKIRSSRVDATRNLVSSLSKLDTPPKTLVCASAIGFYSDRGDEELDETSTSGNGFLAEVCRDWEDAAAAAEEFGMRVVRLRIGVVLNRNGGALAKMLTPFKLCVGGIVGSGRQYWSWIGLTDLTRILMEAVENESLRGAVNAVSPMPPTNREFTKVLGRVLSRPTVFPMPAFIVKLMFGEMGEELLLGSTRVYPRVLEQHGFQFQYGDLESGLRHELA